MTFRFEIQLQAFDDIDAIADYSAYRHVERDAESLFGGPGMDELDREIRVLLHG